MVDSTLPHRDTIEYSYTHKNCCDVVHTTEHTNYDRVGYLLYDQFYNATLPYIR